MSVPVSEITFPDKFLLLRSCCSWVDLHDERDDSEIAEVAEDSTDAKKWPLWKPSNGQDEAVPRNSSSSKPTRHSHLHGEIAPCIDGRSGDVNINIILC